MPALHNTQGIFNLVFGKPTATPRPIRPPLRVGIPPPPNPTERDENTGRPVSLTMNHCVDILGSLKRTSRKPSPTSRNTDALRVKRGRNSVLMPTFRFAFLDFTRLQMSKNFWPHNRRALICIIWLSTMHLRKWLKRTNSKINDNNYILCTYIYVHIGSLSKYYYEPTVHYYPIYTYSDFKLRDYQLQRRSGCSIPGTVLISELPSRN